MSDKEMLDSLEKIWQNIRIDGDSAIYSKMLVILDNIHYLLHDDLQIDYPVNEYEEFLKTEPSGSFDF